VVLNFLQYQRLECIDEWQKFTCSKLKGAKIYDWWCNCRELKCSLNNFLRKNDWEARLIFQEVVNFSLLMCNNQSFNAPVIILLLQDSVSHRHWRRRDSSAKIIPLSKFCTFQQFLIMLPLASARFPMPWFWL